MKKKVDKIWVGIVTGIVLPMIVMGIYYLSTYAHLTAPDFLKKMVFQSILIKLLSLCAIVNLGAFFSFFQTKNDRAARGVIFATLVFAFYVMISKVMGGTL
ncbi:MAG: hypothetical protein JKY48_06785 [Flavobacteriales bacterium]|nr:hypothetical protein [Flavobacteriales bacterium]